MSIPGDEQCKENVNPASNISKVFAMDLDCGINEVVNYTLALGMSTPTQFIIRHTGEICTKTTLDRETVDYYELQVVATDRGGLSSTSIVQVLIGDVNDNSPIFQPHIYNLTIRSSWPITEPIVRCSAHDKDSGIFGKVVYYIVQGNEEGIFNIHESTGEILVVEASRMIKQCKYKLNISAIDAMGFRSFNNALVLITIIDDENRASCYRPRYKISTKENVAQNTFIGSIRNSSISSLTSNILDRFHLIPEEISLHLDAKTGTVKTKVTLDREVRDSYLLSVEVRKGFSAGYCQIEVTVEDENDNPPSFEQNIVRIFMVESYPLRTPFYIAHASDPDTASISSLYYTLDHYSTELFGIDSNAGEIYLIRSLDYEIQKIHKLQVNAFDANLFANLSLTIVLQDVNDNSPVFEKSEYYAEVTESQSFNSQVIQVKALDQDSSNNAQISYQLEGPNYFSISPNTGWIILSKQLDREIVDYYHLVVLGMDNGKPSRTASACVYINVLDDNDNVPYFNSDNYEFDIFENLPSGMLVGMISASDPDLGLNSSIKYALLQKNSSFDVNSITGKITTLEPLDRESKAVHELMLEARDQGVPSHATRVLVKVNVLDVNDNSPEIVDPQSNLIIIREEQPPGTEVVRVRALDNDLAENASVTYTILQDTESDIHEIFTIHPVNGIIKTKIVLDHEDRNVYRLSVKASDAGQPARYSVRMLRIEVLALTDNQPTFTRSSLTFNVREDVDIGYEVGSIAITGATDKFTYILNSVHPHKNVPVFDVERISGQLIVINPLDREDVSEYILEIYASDITFIGSSQNIAVSVKVVIEDVNDNTPYWPVDPLIIMVSEDISIGSNIYNLSAIDLDTGENSNIHYTLVSGYPSPESFFLDSLTGGLTLNQSLDREYRSDYILVFRAEDQALLSPRRISSVTARIIVLDQNDNDPVFVGPITPQLLITSDLYPDSEIFRVIAFDKDADNNGLISYLISASNNVDHFVINQESGLVRLLKPLYKSTELEITAYDHGTPPRKSILKIALRPSVKQSSSLFQALQSNPIIRLSENYKVGADIVNILKFTTEEKENLTFRIPLGVAANTFGVSKSGIVTLLLPLDREKIAHYTLPIFAYSNKFIDFIILTIFVLDENDNNPEFKLSACASLNVPENQKTTIIHTLAAVDIDEGVNGEISYSIINGNIHSKFELNQRTGDLSALTLDREITAKYVLTISAKDKGHPSYETYCNLTVTVLDMNDNAPIFLQTQNINSKLRTVFSNSANKSTYANISFIDGKYSVTIPEDIAPESSILQLQATDPDQDLNGKITYTIIEESTWLFRIDNFTGIITNTGILDREYRNFYSFRVVATDSGKHVAQQTSVLVEIHVSDVNDNHPTFQEYPYRIYIPLSIQPGQNILQIKASDTDENENGELIFSFAQNKDKSKFLIDPKFGMITIASSLAKGNRHIYRLQVLVTDRGNPPLSTQELIEIYVGETPDPIPILHFQNELYSIVLTENSPAGTEVTRVSAIRLDGRKQQVSYSIGYGNDLQTFSIDEKTGIIKVINPFHLDAEIHNHKLLEARIREEVNTLGDNQNISMSSCFELTIIAKTIESELLEAHTKVNIWISDVNDNIPIFTQSQYLATVIEGKITNDFVIKISAYDDDQGLNSQILYHIVDGNRDNAFIINPSYSGIVRTNIVLDREIQDMYHLTIIATDQGSPQLTGTTVLNVRVIDINDNHPTFPENDVISVREDAVIGTLLTTVSANDVDSSPTLMYRFNNLSHKYPFSIDHFQGHILLVDKLDAEIQTEYELQIIVSDGLHETITNLYLRVIDVNDNPPRFEQAVYIASRSVELDTVDEILTIKAADEDITEKNSNINYHLLNNLEGFRIYADTGILTLNRTALANPIAKEIELVVIAQDTGKPKLTTACSVIILFTDIKPPLTGQIYKISIEENTTIGFSLMQLSNIDLFDGIIINGDETGVFDIIREELILVKSLDREIKDRYTIYLGSRTKNVMKNSLECNDFVTVEINVVDVNDNYPDFVDEFNEVTVNEDASLNHVLFVLLARDRDLPGSLSSKIVYDITSGNDAGLFRVNRVNGTVIVNASLDCDINPQIYYLVVMACDTDVVRPLCSLARLHIRLLDVNDNAPKFPLSEYVGFIAENEPPETGIFTAYASDLDYGVYGMLKFSISSAVSFEYSEVDDSWKHFSVEEKSGVVKSCSMFDYEVRDRYVFTLRATDIGGRTAEVYVTIQIESRDEFHPQFTERMYHFGINFYTELLEGTIIGYIQAKDRDKGPDGRVVYQLSMQHPYFKLNRTTGALILKEKLPKIEVNFEEPVKLVVTANSGKRDSLSNTTIVEVSIIDNKHTISLENPTTVIIPSNSDTNIEVTARNGFADWVLGILISLLLLIIGFSCAFLYFYVYSRHHKKHIIKSGQNTDNNITTSNSYIDSIAFDTVPLRNVGAAGVVNINNITVNTVSASSCQLPPPKYDEISPYSQSGPDSPYSKSDTQTVSNSNNSGSLGHGSVEDDGEDEELRKINEGKSARSAMNDVSMPNTKEYLARLGIVDMTIDTSARSYNASPTNSLHLFENSTTTETEIITLIYGKIGAHSKPVSVLEISADPSLNESLSSIVYSEEELTGSYNWDYLLDWGPQYQPLAHVFGEIARLKDDIDSLQSGSNDKIKYVYEAALSPSILISAVSRPLTISSPNRFILPRSPISHNTSSFLSTPVSPSFAPSLSPLATRSPSISPLVPTRINKRSHH